MKLLKMHQPNCRPCSMLEIYLNSLEVTYESKDVSKDKSLIEKYELNSTPVLLLLDDEGNVVERVNGFEPSDTEAIDNLIAKL